MASAADFLRCPDNAERLDNLRGKILQYHAAKIQGMAPPCCKKPILHLVQLHDSQLSVSFLILGSGILATAPRIHAEACQIPGTLILD